MTRNEEERIRQLFREERQADQREAPDFGSVLNRNGQDGREPMGRLRVWAVAAAPVALCLALVVFLVSKNDAPVPAPLSTNSFYWESPTEVYLSAPGEGVLRYVAAEVESVGSEP